MIQLRDDCLLLQKETGETVPCTAEHITVELMGGALGDLDAETVRNAAAGVLHYFKAELGKEFVTVGEFAQALARVLNGFGFAIECSSVGGGVEAQVATADLRELAKASDKGFELEFFSRLRETLHNTLAETPRAVQFHGLRGCVKQLAGARRWCPRCRRLHEQIVDFLRLCLSQDARGRGCALVVR
jgi:hypothetical protein